MDKKIYESPALEIISFEAKERLASEDSWPTDKNNQAALSQQEGWDKLM